jgi:hypothetical protein
VTCRFQPSRPSLLVVLLGAVALGVGFLAPLTAQAGDHQGAGGDPAGKPWVCHPVEGVGETGGGWNLIDPSKASSHIDEVTVAGARARRDGSTDVYAVWADGAWTCPGGTPPTTTTAEPAATTTEPTATSTEPSTDVPETGATVPSTTTSSGSTVPVETPGGTPQQGATVSPTLPGTTADQPEAGVRENAVPQARTDGADLAGPSGGWTKLQSTLVGAGLLMVAAGGLMSVRRGQGDR